MRRPYRATVVPELAETHGHHKTHTDVEPVACDLHAAGSCCHHSSLPVLRRDTRQKPWPSSARPNQLIGQAWRWDVVWLVYMEAFPPEEPSARRKQVDQYISVTGSIRQAPERECLRPTPNRPARQAAGEENHRRSEKTGGENATRMGHRVSFHRRTKRGSRASNDPAKDFARIEIGPPRSETFANRQSR